MTQNSKTRTFKDFDKLIPRKRVAKLGGREIDVSKIPSRVSLELADFADRMENNEINASEQMTETIDIAAKVCSCVEGQEDITTDWLLDHADFEQLLAFMEFVLEPIREKANNGKAGK